MDTSIIENCELKKFQNGDIIIEQNEKTEGIYVLKSGKVEVLIDNEVVSILEEKGDFFGEMSVLFKEPRNATIRALSDEVVTYHLSREDFQALRDRIGEEVLAKSLKRTIENCERDDGTLKPMF